MSAVPSRISSKAEAPESPDAGAPQRREAYEAGKRWIDIALAFLMLLLSLPFCLLFAVAIKIDSRGPVFFSNRAVGRHGRIFTIYKLRSMRVRVRSEAETADVLNNFVHHEPTAYKDGRPVYKTALTDERITRVGRVLRRTSLDELPQLWNILRGDLSFVGPRPSLPDEVALYADWQRQRLLVPQGLTGLYQVTARNRVPIDEMIRIDLDYIRKRSLWLDIKILCKTPFAMFSGM